MRALIKALEGQADIVLFDAPPVMAVTDALTLSMQVDGVLVVNDAGRTRRARAQRVVEWLRQVDANVLGVVLNRVPSRRENYYAYSYGYYTANRDSQQSEHVQRGGLKKLGLAMRRLAGLGLVGERARDERTVPRRPKRRRIPERLVSSDRAGQRRQPRSLDKRVGVHGGSRDRRPNLDQHQITEEPTLKGDGDRRNDQPLPPGAHPPSEPESVKRDGTPQENPAAPA